MSAEPPPSADAPAPLWWGRLGPELRWHAELMRLLVDPVFHGRDVPRGDGLPVLLVPGFGAGDYTLGPMALWLRRVGYRSSTCGIWLGATCGDRALHGIERRVTALHGEQGRRIAVIGHSHGGFLAKALGARRPDLVSHVIALGSGLSRQYDVAVPGLAAVAIARAVHRRTTDRVERRGCMTDACTCPFTRAYAGPFPAGVRLTSIYSKGDGMVRWQSCVAPYAENVEVTGSHVGLAFNRKTYRAIGHALAHAAEGAEGALARP